MVMGLRIPLRGLPKVLRHSLAKEWLKQLERTRPSNVILAPARVLGF